MTSGEGAGADDGDGPDWASCAAVGDGLVLGEGAGEFIKGKLSLVHSTSSEDESSCSVAGSRYSSPEESTGDRKPGSSSTSSSGADLPLVMMVFSADNMASRLGLKTMKIVINISLKYDNMYGHRLNDGEYFHIGPTFDETDLSFLD